jgi:hypothetical protein
MTEGSNVGKGFVYGLFRIGWGIAYTYLSLLDAGARVVDVDFVTSKNIGERSVSTAGDGYQYS